MFSKIKAKFKTMTPANEGRPIYIFDLDGTLSNTSHRVHFLERQNTAAYDHAAMRDRPNHQVVAALLMALESGREVQVWSARTDEQRGDTVKWLSIVLGVSESDADKMLFTRMNDELSEVERKSAWLDCMDRADYMRIAAVYEDDEQCASMFRYNGIPVFHLRSV